MNRNGQSSAINIGVGLRHDHYADVLADPADGSAAKVADIDFVEVHAENFFAEGGAAPAFLQEVAATYPVSIHSTTLGLGSAVDIPAAHLKRLKGLLDKVPPFLLSDHACFAWSSVDGRPAHAGDLLPIPFNEASLKLLVDNIRRVQDTLGHQLLVENLSGYFKPAGSEMGEAEFLVSACEQAGSRLLLDLNNLAVNAINDEVPDIVLDITRYIDAIPVGIVGEIHLAGCSPVAPGELMIDDHSQPVPGGVWEAYRLAIRRFGNVPSLIEWDNELPAWQSLVAEAGKARVIAEEELAANQPAMDEPGQEQAG